MSDNIIIEEDKKDEKNNINTNRINSGNKENEIDYGKPFFKDEEKTKYKINNLTIEEIDILKTKNYPLPRCYLTAEYSSKNNSIICIGGSDESCEQNNKITEYNIKDNIWKYWNNEEQIEFDLELSGHSSNLVKINEIEKIFVFGGYDNWKKEFTSQSYFINLSNKSFEKINYNVYRDEKIEFPSPRTYHSSNYDEDKQIIYIYGGTDMNINNSKNNNFQSVWAFNLIKKCWKKIELVNGPPHGAPKGHSSILFDNKLYIFGGVILFKKFTNKLYTIDLNTKKIENIDYNGAAPKAITFHSAILIDKHKFLIHGGLGKNYTPINDCYIFYFNDNKFEKINIPLIPNLFGHKIVMNNNENKLFIIGGMNSFKYVGDENLIYQLDEEGEILFKENQIKFNPMLNILEIILNNKEEKIEEKIKVNEKKELVKKRRWKKAFY